MDYYAPDYKLHVPVSNMENDNTPEQLEKTKVIITRDITRDIRRGITRGIRRDRPRWRRSATIARGADYDSADALII